MSYMAPVGISETNMQEAQLNNACEGLLVKIFQQPRDENRGCVIALTSPHPGAGVTRIAGALETALRQEEDDSVISLDCRALSARTEQTSSANGSPETDGADKRWRVQPKDHWSNSRKTLLEAIQQLQSKYRYVLIDCPSMRESQDAVKLAPLVDGIVLVIEANRTQKDQIRYAERTIEAARGRIIGYVLNKRTYSVPDWLYRRLEAFGI